MIKLLVFLILVTQFVFTQTAKDLIGSWQAVPYVAAGYDETYTFNEDGTFTFHYNQMDCAKREISYGGSWVLKGKTIELNITYSEYLAGGRYQPPTGSCGSDSELVDASYVKKIIIPFERETLKLSGYNSEDIDGFERTSMLINNRKYYMFSKFEF
ncbi:MAG: hypothetical protein UZ05_CHB002001093 [Chlorobi bacterium OLB5]|nr:MAG: hypothetical protein UZ05_CHB002001093 [Chlorobi bacterium OLB5]